MFMNRRAVNLVFGSQIFDGHSIQVVDLEGLQLGWTKSILGSTALLTCFAWLLNVANIQAKELWGNPGMVRVNPYKLHKFELCEPRGD